MPNIIMTIRASYHFTTVLILLLIPQSLQAQARVESNVIYGMYSGLALLMDVHYPSEPNGYGIICIPGSGWHARLNLDAQPLKQGVERHQMGAKAFLGAGYTLFSINHRAAPRFRYPAAVEDAQRALRFIRYHASRFKINPDKIGATGGSSGGHLVSMLGVLDGDGNPDDPSPIEQRSSKVQAVVALYPPTDFVDFGRGSTTLGSFLGTRFYTDEDSDEFALYRKASPTFHVSPDDPPVLLIHGDADEAVPFRQSELFQEELKKAGVTVVLIRIRGGNHGFSVSDGPSIPDYFTPAVEWFDRHLRNLP